MVLDMSKNPIVLIAFVARLRFLCLIGPLCSRFPILGFNHWELCSIYYYIYAFYVYLYYFYSPELCTHTHTHTHTHTCSGMQYIIMISSSSYVKWVIWINPFKWETRTKCRQKKIIKCSVGYWNSTTIADFGP